MLQHTAPAGNSEFEAENVIGVRCDSGLPDDTIIYDRDPDLEAYLDELETARDTNADAEADYERWLEEQAEIIEAEFQLYEAGVALDLREALGSKSDGPRAA